MEDNPAIVVEDSKATEQARTATMVDSLAVERTHTGAAVEDSTAIAAVVADHSKVAIATLSMD